MFSKKQKLKRALKTSTATLLTLGILLGFPGMATANTGKVAYKIVQGDTLAGIARKNYTDAPLIAAMNNLAENATLTVGQVIYLPKDPEIEVQVAQGDTIWTLAKKHSVSTDYIINYNKLSNPEELKLGQKLLLPVVNVNEEPKSIAVMAIASRGQSLQRQELAAKANTTSKALIKNATNTVWRAPLQGIVTSAFGKRSSGYHHGTDIAAPKGTKIQAVADGKVTFAGWKNDIYGYAVEIDHGNGWKTFYAHSSKVLVKTGYNVKAGKNIALVGSTGNSTGPHLHIEFHKDGTVLNPLKYINVSK